LTTNGYVVLGTSAPTTNSRLRKGGGLVFARILVLLTVFALLLFAALNGTTPWGP